MLAAAVAAGVTSTFGAPIGGVLFSIEVTSTYYVVGNLWKAFFCAIWCVCSFKTLQNIPAIKFIPETDFDKIEFFGNYEFFSYALLGVISGIIGALFVYVFSQISVLRTKLRFPFISG
jgi:chloride channel 2